MLLFKDSIRLFAAYNEGVINLLGKSNPLLHSGERPNLTLCFRGYVLLISKQRTVQLNHKSLGHPVTY